MALFALPLVARREVLRLGEGLDRPRHRKPVVVGEIAQRIVIGDERSVPDWGQPGRKFGIQRREAVIIMGQVLAVFIYVRNIMLIVRNKSKQSEAA